MALNTILIFRYREGKSDKIWAIEELPDRDGRHRVFWGRYGSKLTKKEFDRSSTCSNHVAKKVERKVNSGYNRVLGYINRSQHYQLPNSSSVADSTWFGCEGYPLWDLPDHPVPLAIRKLRGETDASNAIDDTEVDDVFRTPEQRKSVREKRAALRNVVNSICTEQSYFF